MDALNIFYQEPNPDRWIKFDRYPRQLIRRLVRGRARPGGIMMFALQLIQGLDKINYPYRFNDFDYAKKHPEELICIIGKPHMLFERKWRNPILFGPGIYSHPLECPDLFARYPNVKKCIVSCDWMSKMFEPYYSKKNLITWPVGIDTDKWCEKIKNKDKTIDFLIYDKIRWEYNKYNNELLSPITTYLEKNKFSFEKIKYGNYNHDILTDKLSRCKAVIFLCEHETQGLACQQILATDTPMLVWDRQGYWQDPAYYPDKVLFGPVTPVPYWSDNCGLKFKDADEFEQVLPLFINRLLLNKFKPRKFVLSNLRLEQAALNFLEIVKSLS